MKTVKLDGRHTGFGKFKYRIDYKHREERGAFHLHRIWFWETFGASCEIEGQYIDPESNPLWCWEYSHSNTRIYVQSDQEMNWFMLKWD